MTQLANPPPPAQAGAVVLWVEDLVTSTYLSECWQFDPDISILMAGGSQNVIALVEHYRKMGVGNVFGFIDRDFNNTNRLRWLDPTGSRVFRSEAHEVENFILDAQALATCGLNTGKRSEHAIETRIAAMAATLPWWMACRQLITQMSRDIINDFPCHPAYRHIPDQPSASAYITSQPWYQDISSRVAGITAPGYITTALNNNFAVFSPMLGNGSWRQHFCGKEIFHDIRDWIFTAPGSPYGEARDADLAKAVAQEQTKNGTLPQEILDLRIAIRTRAGI